MRVETLIKTLVWDDSSLCPETSTKNAVQEFDLRSVYLLLATSSHLGDKPLTHYRYSKVSRKQKIKTFLIEDLSICHPELRISPRICDKKFKTAPMVYSGAWGNWFMKKNLKSKISWHCPLTYLIRDSLTWSSGSWSRCTCGWRRSHSWSPASIRFAPTWQTRFPHSEKHRLANTYLKRHSQIQI